ncbi:MAG: FKBP-type peptidyl-prolyl cis-trans isomerase [Thermoanaerobaculia bacterium]
MQTAKEGDTVQVHYTGTLEDGETFDSSNSGEPLEFTIGAGEVVPGFEAAVTGMAEGEKKTAKIASGDAYGERHDELVFSVKKSQIPEDVEVKIGDRLAVGLPTGETVPMEVTGIGEESVTLDANHPLAGKDLTFDLELVKIV